MILSGKIQFGTVFKSINPCIWNTWWCWEPYIHFLIHYWCITEGQIIGRMPYIQPFLRKWAGTVLKYPFCYRRTQLRTIKIGPKLFIIAKVLRFFISKGNLNDSRTWDCSYNGYTYSPKLWRRKNVPDQHNVPK